MPYRLAHTHIRLVGSWMFYSELQSGKTAEEKDVRVDITSLTQRCKLLVWNSSKACGQSCGLVSRAPVSQRALI